MKRAQNVTSDVQRLWRLGGWVQLSSPITRRLRWNLLYWQLAKPNMTVRSETCPTYASSGHWNTERNQGKFNLWGRLDMTIYWRESTGAFEVRTVLSVKSFKTMLVPLPWNLSFHHICWILSLSLGIFSTHRGPWNQLISNGWRSQWGYKDTDSLSEFLKLLLSSLPAYCLPQVLFLKKGSNRPSTHPFLAPILFPGQPGQQALKTWNRL